MTMRLTFKYILVIAIALLATAVSSYAQKQGSDNVDENMLRYRYVDRDNRKIEFSGPRTFGERIYLFAGTGIEGLYQLGNHPASPGYAIGSRIGMGYWATPIHGFEASLSYGMMPYGYWERTSSATRSSRTLSSGTWDLRQTTSSTSPTTPTVTTRPTPSMYSSRQVSTSAPVTSSNTASTHPSRSSTTSVPPMLENTLKM